MRGQSVDAVIREDPRSRRLEQANGAGSDRARTPAVNVGGACVKGTQTTDPRRDQRVRTIGPPSRGRFPFVVVALVYLLLRRLVRLTAISSNEQLDTEVELVVVRHQLRVLKRQVGRPRLRRRERVFMAAMSRVLPRPRWSAFLVSPQTLLRWHRELVRRKWTFRRRSTGGRPPISEEVRELILRMGRENPRWGCIRIRGELAKLGTWSTFLRSQAGAILALDFFTVETVLLQTLCVLFAIHIATRRVTILGVTRNPDSAWVTQQARNLAVGEPLRGVRYVIRDRDTKFSGPFDE